VGPYGAEIRDVAAAASVGYDITYAVTNEGTRPGRAKCQLVATGESGQRLRARITITSQIAGGATAELTETIAELEVAPANVTVDCS
jgi:hypothetical protein